jgi:hypothetical protein
MTTTTNRRPTQTDRAVLERLWRALAEYFAWYLDNVPREKWRTNMLNQIRQFLRDNGCAANAAHQVRTDRERLHALLSLGVPFGGPDGEGH